MSGLTISERVYLDANGKATTDETKADSLWATPGDEVTTDEAAAVGYSGGSSEAPDGVPFRELQARLKALGLPAGGTREELEARLAEAEED